MGINLERLKSSLLALGEIGKTPGGGVTRVSFSKEDKAYFTGFLGRRTVGPGPRCHPASNSLDSGNYPSDGCFARLFFQQDNGGQSHESGG